MVGSACASTNTSNAEVGSSQTWNLGSGAGALAMEMHCRAAALVQTEKRPLVAADIAKTRQLGRAP